MKLGDLVRCIKFKDSVGIIIRIENVYPIFWVTVSVDGSVNNFASYQLRVVD